MSGPLPEVAVYIHCPFCPTKCGYCDFNSYAMEGEIVRRTVDAMLCEIDKSPWRGIPAKTIFFGGGTPTFFESSDLIRLLEAVSACHPPVQGAEITSEANPGTVDADKFSALREAGFNRISLGAQSFLDEDLIRLGRVHRSGHIERAVMAARSAGFENINVDLMFALPDQTLKAWKANLERAIGLETEHLSLYGLTLEPNTAFYKRHLTGDLTVPGEDLQVQMYDLACEKTREAGFAQYEISNFSKPGFECAHNLCYWRNECYAGYGPGAVGTMPTLEGRCRRYTNLKHPLRFCEAAESGSDLYFEEEILTEQDLRLERIMMGLRLNEGLSRESLNLADGAVEEVAERGWIDVTQDRLLLTAAGRHFCSEATLALA